MILIMRLLIMRFSIVKIVCECFRHDRKAGLTRCNFLCNFSRSAEESNSLQVAADMLHVAMLHCSLQ